MSSYTGLSPKDPNKYLGPNVYLSSIVTRNREPTGADYRQPETGKIYPLGSYWLISANPTTGTQGDLWYLSKIVANVAYWLQVSSGGSGTLIDIQVDAVTAPGVNPVTPLLGEIDFNGAAVANHSVPVETRSRALHAMNLEVQYATSAAATDATKSGLAHFNSTQFSVDANGFVALAGGGIAIDSLGVQATSGGGTNPVVADGTGKIDIAGAVVAAGTNPIRSVSTAANTLQIQAQISQALAATDATKIGLSNFNSAQFSVDANGFVSATQITTGGTFVPALTFGGASVGMTYTTQNGNYTKVGNLVIFVAHIVLTLKGASTGAAFVTGLPFTSGVDRVSCFLNLSDTNIPANTYIILAQIASGGTSIELIYGTTGSPQGGGSIDDTFFVDGAALRVSGFYFTA